MMSVVLIAAAVLGVIGIVIVLMLLGGGKGEVVPRPGAANAAPRNNLDLSKVTDPIERGLLELISIGPEGQFITVVIPGTTPGNSQMMQFGAPVKSGKDRVGFALLVNIPDSERGLLQRTKDFLELGGFEPWEDDGGIHAYTPVDAKESTKIARDIIEKVFGLPRDAKVDVEVC